VILRDDLLQRSTKKAASLPTMMNYAVHAENRSLYNTPPAFGIYAIGLVVKWLKDLGGLPAIAAINERKAAKLYAAIDSSGFYKNPVDKACRSWMNVPFTLKDAALDKPFLQEAKAAGLTNLKGHRVVGGMRASIYNAMPEAGVDALIEFMNDFAKRHG